MPFAAHLPFLLHWESQHVPLKQILGLAFARFQSANFWLCQFVNYSPGVCK